MDEITLSSLPFGKPHVMRSPYYKPFFEEFHIGFEYEIFEDWDADEDKSWHKQTYGEDGTNSEHIGYIGSWSMNKVRVKVLDEADITQLGFELNHEEKGNPNKMFFLGKHSLIWNYKGWCILTVRSDERQEDYTAYVGYLRNKSELKRILQMTGCVEW